MMNVTADFLGIVWPKNNSFTGEQIEAVPKISEWHSSVGRSF